MKKIIALIFLTIFLFSCQTENNQVIENKKEQNDLELIKKITKDLPNMLAEWEKQEKLEKKKKQAEILKANFIANIPECWNYKNNSNLWINRKLWFRACLPYDYMTHYEIWSIWDISDDATEIWLVSWWVRTDWYFSTISIESFKLWEKIANYSWNNENTYLFKTKTHNIIFTFDKTNSEHIDFIKSLKLVDDLIKIKPNTTKEIKLQYVNIHTNNNLEEILNRNTISFYTWGFDNVDELKNKKNIDLKIIDTENKEKNILYNWVDFNKKFNLDSSFRPFMYKWKIGFTWEKNKKLNIFYDWKIISKSFEPYEESIFSLESEIPFRILKNGLLQYIFRMGHDYYIWIINLKWTK